MEWNKKDEAYRPYLVPRLPKDAPAFGAFGRRQAG